VEVSVAGTELAKVLPLKTIVGSAAVEALAGVEKAAIPEITSASVATTPSVFLVSWVFFVILSVMVFSPNSVSRRESISSLLTILG
jgi:hypothetical protein